MNDCQHYLKEKGSSNLVTVLGCVFFFFFFDYGPQHDKSRLHDNQKFFFARKLQVTTFIEK